MEGYSGKVLRIGGARCFLFAVILGWIGNLGLAAGAVQEIKTAERIGLANGLMSIEFDSKTGELVSLKNLETKDEYLKDLGGGGNPFRAYIDCNELPFELTHPWPDMNPPVEGALGGKLIDGSDCQLKSSAFEKQEGATVLRLEMQHAAPKLMFKVEVRMTDKEPLVSVSLTVSNNGDAKHLVMMGWPYLTGIGLGKDRETNLGVRLRELGQSRAPAWTLNGDIYARGWSGQWNAAYEPKMDEGIGMIIKDPEVIDKLIRRFEGGGMSVFYFDNNTLDINKEIKYPVTEILVHKGDWKVTARRYGEWFKGAFKLREIPKWVDNVDMFVGSWVPHPDTIAKYRKAAEAKGTIESSYKNSPEAPGVMLSFRDMQRLYLGGQYDLQEWAYYWHSISKTDAYNAYDHTDGLYQIRLDLGGAPALHDGVARLEQIGRVMGCYVASKTVRLDSDFFKGSDPKDWLLMGTPDQKIPADAKSIWICAGYKPWREHIAHVCKRLLWETGARYIRLDEFGQLFETCYNPAHHHESPYYNCTKRNLEFLQKVREAMDEVDPQSLLLTEGGSDLLNVYCTGALRLWWGGQDIAPLRLAVPNYMGFSYGGGQIESALNGYVCANLEGTSSGGGFTEHHNNIWGPGLEHFPPCYTQEGRMKKARWHELGYTFVEAARRGNPTDINPTVPAYSAEELVNWAGRLWRSDKYWLLTCGNQAGIRPEKPVKVKLPELAAEIKTAYEFDFETLKMQEAAISREQDGIYVTTNDGFSAVFLPKPECKPLVEMSELTEIKYGTPVKVNLSSFGPWRKAGDVVQVDVKAPGLKTSATSVTLPAEVEISVPDEAEAGYYYIEVNGDTLGLKRWIKIGR